MITTRDRLIKYIEARQSATAKEISLALNLSAADIRHHLTYLVQEGVLDIIGTKKNNDRGRPSRIYVIANSLYKDNLYILTDALLEQLFTNFVIYR